MIKGLIMRRNISLKLGFHCTIPLYGVSRGIASFAQLAGRTDRKRAVLRLAMLLFVLQAARRFSVWESDLN